MWTGFQIWPLSASRLTHLPFITNRNLVKGWVKQDADAGSNFEADPQFMGTTSKESRKTIGTSWTTSAGIISRSKRSLWPSTKTFLVKVYVKARGRNLATRWLHGEFSGGEIGIRTLGGVTPTLDFESSAFDHSAISPQLGYRKLFFITYFFAKLNTRFQFCPASPCKQTLHPSRKFTSATNARMYGHYGLFAAFLQILLTFLVSGKSPFPRN